MEERETIKTIEVKDSGSLSVGQLKDSCPTSRYRVWVRRQRERIDIRCQDTGSVTDIQKEISRTKKKGERFTGNQGLFY